MKSQEAQILQYLKTGKALTPIDALRMFGCFRLSARIYDLKARKHRINTHKIRVGKNKIVASYRMATRK